MHSGYLTGMGAGERGLRHYRSVVNALHVLGRERCLLSKVGKLDKLDPFDRVCPVFEKACMPTYP